MQKSNGSGCRRAVPRIGSAVECQGQRAFETLPIAMEISVVLTLRVWPIEGAPVRPYYMVHGNISMHDGRLSRHSLSQIS